MKGFLLLLGLIIGLLIGYLVGSSRCEVCGAEDRIVGVTGEAAPFTIIPDPVVAYRGDALKWVHPTADTLELRLPGMAVEDTLLRVGRGDTAATRVLEEAPLGEALKYTITVRSGDSVSTQDPEIIVKPRG